MPDALVVMPAALHVAVIVVFAYVYLPVFWAA
jgi:hypothetical protein